MRQIENTVSAENQMINSSTVSFLGRADAPYRILIVGNSITRHGPKEEIGWSGDWGMAASAPACDYVHRLYESLSAAGREVFIRVRQASEWELHFLEDDCLSRFSEDRAFGADLVIFRLGENVRREQFEQFGAAAEKFVDYLANGHADVLLTTVFWPQEVQDRAIRALAARRGFACAEIGCTEDDMMAFGLFEHKGVAAHPGDAGMAMIASRIAEKLL